MSTETTTTSQGDNPTGDEGGTQTQENANIRQLRDKANRADTLESENASLKQQLALKNAGLNLNDKQLRALNAAHEGESNPEEWRKTAQELGFVQPPTEGGDQQQQTQQTAQQQTTLTPAEQLAHAQVQAASSGAIVPTQQAPADRYAQANNPQEVLDMVRQSGGIVADDMQ